MPPGLLSFFLHFCCPLTGAIVPLSPFGSFPLSEKQTYSFSHQPLIFKRICSTQHISTFYFYIDLFIRIISITSNRFKSLKLTTSLMCLKRFICVWTQCSL